MYDLNLFRALKASRETLEQEFQPSTQPRLADEVTGATPKYIGIFWLRQHTLQKLKLAPTESPVCPPLK